MEGRDLRHERSRMPPAARSGTRSPLKYKVKTHTLTHTEQSTRWGTFMAAAQVCSALRCFRVGRAPFSGPAAAIGYAFKKKEKKR